MPIVYCAFGFYMFSNPATFDNLVQFKDKISDPQIIRFVDHFNVNHPGIVYLFFIIILLFIKVVYPCLYSKK